jgi:hypothetical protein
MVCGMFRPGLSLRAYHCALFPFTYAPRPRSLRVSTKSIKFPKTSLPKNGLKIEDS